MDTGQSKTIFITGATGLVGGHAVEEAIRRGHRVRALVRATSDTRWLDQWDVEKIPGDLADADVAAASGSTEPTGFSTAPPRSVTGGLSRNFASSTSRPSSSSSRPPRAAQVQRFVHVSSLGVYEGRDHHGTDETVPPAANSLDAYTRSKTEAEALVLKYHKERGLPAAVVRPGFIYGERDRTVLPKLLTNLRRGTFAYFGSGKQALNCIYVKNLVHGIFLAAENPAAVGQVFNLTDGETVSKTRFVGRVAELAGLQAAHAAHPAGTGEVPRHGRRGDRQAPRGQEPAADQQGPVQVPGAESRLLDRQGTKGPGLPAPLRLRRGHRACHGRAPAPAAGKTARDLGRWNPQLIPGPLP